jgi:DNA-binding transcriptional ArsR family regulator
VLEKYNNKFALFARLLSYICDMILKQVEKVEDFSILDVTLAKYAKAFSHPARVAILKLLIQKQACICGDIVEELPLAQSTVSQHLKVLKEAGLIKGEIEGSTVCYCINEKEWAIAKNLLHELFGGYQPLSGNCC